jgi:hypothetical protein
MHKHIVDILLQQEPGQVMVRALRRLLDSDSLLLEIDVNERSITHRLALYLQECLPQLHVDCEYNRDGIDPKRIQHLGLYPDDEDTDAKTAFPDIIAHIRGTRENYLVIELKKTTNHTGMDVDFAKLRGYKKNLNFMFALFIELRTRGAADVATAQWI